MKKAFTIVELLMVIGIIGVLMGIVTTAAAGAVKNSRVRRAQALCAIVQAGLNTYRAVHDKDTNPWPVSLPDERQNYEGNATGSTYATDPDKIVLNGSEVRICVRALAQAAKDRAPVMDVSGLFVSRQEGRYGQRCYGLDFMHAIHGTRESSKKMKLEDMYFGYPESSNGYFRHFKIVYSIPTDTMTVTTMDDDQLKATRYE